MQFNYLIQSKKKLIIKSFISAFKPTSMLYNKCVGYWTLCFYLLTAAEPCWISWTIHKTSIININICSLLQVTALPLTMSTLTCFRFKMLFTKRKQSVQISVLEMISVHTNTSENMHEARTFTYNEHACAGMNMKQIVYSAIGCLFANCSNKSVFPACVGNFSIIICRI